ncbi:MAG: ABC transporter permease subunit [Richelia sp.]|nr:ABC transporter permease subunit [Richelia sp.]
MIDKTHTPKLPLWRDERFWRITSQLILIFILGVGIAIFAINLTRNLQQLGIQFGFGFLQQQASFDIGETPIPYKPSDSYSRALIIGLINSLRIAIAGIILTTIVGIGAGIARLSDNWLVRNLSLVYVEIFRNTPLLLQLLFWYSAVFLGLPKVENKLSLGNLIYLSQASIEFPWFTLAPEFSALLLGLIFYTGSFIAEIVRGGIQSVPKGQWEASVSLGLKPSLTMRLVVFPQALRVIIPPLTSQYLNLTKNSSLAIAIGYPDIYFVASTTFNQTGRAVEVMLLIMLTYLTISLITSVSMNIFNRTVQIKER